MQKPVTIETGDKNTVKMTSKEDLFHVKNSQMQG
jgi:hypothetical protein